jgi:hypothetical protein
MLCYLCRFLDLPIFSIVCTPNFSMTQYGKKLNFCAGFLLLLCSLFSALGIFGAALHYLSVTTKLSAA